MFRQSLMEIVPVAGRKTDSVITRERPRTPNLNRQSSRGSLVLQTQKPKEQSLAIQGHQKWKYWRAEIRYLEEAASSSFQVITVYYE